MKEYIKKFESASAANDYAIVDIPFTTSVAPSSGYPSISYIQNLRCNQTNKKLVNNNGIVSVYSDEPVPPVGPPNDEIWYTTTDGEPIDLSGGGSGSGSGSGADWPEHTNTYEGGKGVIKFTEDLTEIPSSGFRNIKNLETITLPDSLTRIGIWAFVDCSNLTSINIPDSVTFIGHSAFYDCSSLEKVVITDITAWCNIDFEYACDSTTCNPLHYANHLYLNNTEITNLVIPNSITIIKDGTFAGYSGLTSVTIPNNVTSIGYEAFSHCSGLTSVTLPNSVTSIGEYAFLFCSGLEEIVCEPTTPPSLGANDVFNETNDCPIYVPSQSVDAYKAATYWSKYASRIQAIQ